MLPKKLDFLRRHGFTDKQLGRICGIDPSTISRIRTGVIKEPAYSVGVEIDRVYDLAVKAKHKRECEHCE